MVRETEKAKNTLGLFMDTGKSSGQLHTGVVVMYPGEATEQCLMTWGKGLARNGRSQVRQGKDHTFKFKENFDVEEGQMTESEMEFFGPDQKALASSKACKATKGVQA